MKYRLSHQQTEIIQLIGLVITGIFPWLIVLIFINTLPLTWAIIGAVLINSLTFYFSLRIYKAEFDTDFLYLKKRLISKKIPLENVVNIKSLPFPIYIYFGHAYILTLTYIEKDRPQKIFIISREIFSWRPTLDNVTEIGLLRQNILSKKYGR